MITPAKLKLAQCQPRTAKGGIRVCDVGSILNYETIARLSSFGQPYLVANLEQAGLPLPTGVQADDDLFSQAPEEIRREHSLHLIGPDDRTTWHELIEKLRDKGALVVIFSKKSRDELVKDLRLYWAWYARPQTVKMVFEQGSENLAKGLMTGVEAVLTATAAAEGWSLYARPGLEVNLDELLGKA
jgi:hypothetical protein